MTFKHNLLFMSERITFNNNLNYIGMLIFLKNLYSICFNTLISYTAIAFVLMHS